VHEPSAYLLCLRERRVLEEEKNNMPLEDKVPRKACYLRVQIVPVKMHRFQRVIRKPKKKNQKNKKTKQKQKQKQTNKKNQGRFWLCILYAVVQMVIVIKEIRACWWQPYGKQS
jgi:cytoskeletal protein RodZ